MTKRNILTKALFGAVLLVSNAQTGLIPITSVDQYNELYNSDKPMITMFSASWCGPCKATKPRFSAAANANSDITFAYVDTDNKALSSITKSIRGIPTFVYSHKGKNIKRESGGMKRSEINKRVSELRAQTK